MGITTTTTRISSKWLERKSKHELAGIIMNNLDKIDLFADELQPTQWAYDRACEAIEKHRKRAEQLQATIMDCENALLAALGSSASYDEFGNSIQSPEDRRRWVEMAEGALKSIQFAGNGNK